MKAVIRVIALTLLMSPVIASAQEQPQHPLAGFWRGPMVAGGGEDTDVTVEMRIQGDVVTGPIATMPVSDLYMRDGSVTANSVRFTSPSLDPSGQGGALVWTGHLTGDNQLVFSVVPEAGGDAREFVLTKREATTPPGGGR